MSRCSPGNSRIHYLTFSCRIYTFVLQQVAISSHHFTTVFSRNSNVQSINHNDPRSYIHTFIHSFAFVFNTSLTDVPHSLTLIFLSMHSDVCLSFDFKYLHSPSFYWIWSILNATLVFKQPAGPLSPSRFIRIIILAS